MVHIFREAGIPIGSSVEHYTPSELKRLNLPIWKLTNSVPLSPDDAIVIAFRELGARHPNITRWDVERVEIVKEIDGIWIYLIDATDRTSGGMAFESIRVLMNGEVWKPVSNRR